MSPGPLLGASFVALVASVPVARRAPCAWLGLVLAGATAALVASVAVLGGGAAWTWRSAFPVCGEPLHLRLDALSALFLALLAVLGGAGAAYAREYWSDAERPRSAPRGRAWWSGIVACLGLVLVASDGLHFLVAWEAFSICAYALVTLDRTRADARAAGWLYLGVSHAAGLLLFVFFASLADRTGGWALGPMRDRADLAPLFWLALLAFGAKAGQFPLHVWLPSAHASAPSHVSAILSGVSIKVGVYGILRFGGWLPTPEGAGTVVLLVGGAGAVAGIAFALAQDDLKRLLAYSSVENVGVVLVGVGAALVARDEGGAAWGRLALVGALLHVWNHGAFKALLFFSAGSVLHATGTREMSRLGGLGRAMPRTATLFALGAAAVAGVPPLNGFVGEWFVVLGLFDASTAHGASADAALPAVVLLATSGALTLATFAKAGAVTFLGAPRTEAVAHAHEVGPFMRGPAAILAGVCLVVGLAPALVLPAVVRAAGAWHEPWGAVAGPGPVAPLGWFHLALAAAVVGAVALLVRCVRANGVRRAPTWGCGYASPSPRMQYTSGSFAALASGWFGWILRPERRVRRPRGLHPAAAVHVERVPETVLERVVVPASRALLRVSTAVRRLQHGRAHAYILYLVVGLAGVAALVFAWGGP